MGRTALKTEAIVLHTLDYGESDRIVTFYTADAGKLKGIAKGARRSRRRFVNTLEPFCRSELLYSRSAREGLAFLEDTRLIDPYAAIRGDLEQNLLASYLAELTDHFSVEGKKGNALYALLRDFLDLMERGAPGKKLVRFFEIRLLKWAGYEPVLDRCIACKTPVRPDVPYRFSVAEGGIRCAVCSSFSPAETISLGSIRTLLAGKEMDPDRLCRLTLSDQTQRECQDVLVTFIRHILGRDLRSLQVWNQVMKFGP